MSEGYVAESQSEAERFEKTLDNLTGLLASEKLESVYAVDASKLRALRERVMQMLVEVRGNLKELAAVEKADFFRTDPTLAGRRHLLIENIEANKVKLEYDVLPDLERLTQGVVEHAKQDPTASVDVSALPSAEKWTVQRVIETAEHYLDQAKGVVGVVTKAYGIARALGLLLGVPVP